MKKRQQKAKKKLQQQQEKGWEEKVYGRMSILYSTDSDTEPCD